MKITISKCDLCKKEYRSDGPIRHWSDRIEQISLNMKTHPAVQTIWDLQACSTCAYKIKEAIDNVIESLTIKN